MRGFAILWQKEARALFSSPIAYAVVAAFLLIMGYSFTLTLFVSHAPTLVHLFFQMFVLFLLTVPIITSTTPPGAVSSGFTTISAFSRGAPVAVST